MKKVLIITLGLFLACLNMMGQDIAPFKIHDRVSFLGNSITHEGRYHSFVWLYYMTRFPDMPIWISNDGIGGDGLKKIYRRFDGDVMAKEPTTIVVTFGMNDSEYNGYNGPDPEAFAERVYNESHENFLLLEKRLQELENVRIIMMGTSPYDEIAEIEGREPLHGKNDNIKRIIEFQKKSAIENGWDFIDLNGPMVEISRRICVADPGFTLCGEDRIHPGNDGHLVMAYLFLKEQGFAGKEVASVNIDATKKDVVDASGCKIRKLKFTENGLSFDYLASALPYPVDTVKRGWASKKSASDALHIIPFMEDMNREIIRVSGLQGDYELRIDDQPVGVWSAGELDEGVNLAECRNTPQYQQATTVMLLNEERYEIERRFREYIITEYNFFYDQGLLFADDQRSVDAMNDAASSGNGWIAGRRDAFSKMMRPEIRNILQQQMENIVKTIYKVNKPVTRRVTLEKVK